VPRVPAFARLMTSTPNLRLFPQSEEHLDYLSLQVRVERARLHQLSVLSVRCADRSDASPSLPSQMQALLFKQTGLGFAGQIRVFFQHTRRLD
jgi:hypothetical protein